MAAMRTALFLPLLSGVAAGSVELVLSRGEDVADEALDWVQEHTGTARVTMYTKGRKPADRLANKLTEVALPNVGMDVHSFLYHIVKHYDALAEKTVFMPAGKPSYGFSGFHQDGASLLPGVSTVDYLSPDSRPLFVPTMAVTPDLQQMSVRMAFMEQRPEKDVPGGRSFTPCSADGKAGWSPLLPNKFSHTVLEPLMKAQDAKDDLEAFWKKHLPEQPMPEMLAFALGSSHSLSRSQILANPKSFYEKLSDDLTSSKSPYQAYFVEYMWWYLFNSSPLCTDDLPKVAVPEGSSHHRQLGSSITVLDPHPGAQLHFGDVVKIGWATSLNTRFRVELYRFGNFITVLMNYINGNSMNWVVSVGPSALTGKPGPSKQPWAHASDTNLGYKKYTSPFLLTPADKYTIRICPDNDINLLQTDEGHCDSDPYAESGEFDILATVAVTSPATNQVYSAETGANAAANTLPMIPIHWTNYFADQSTLTVRLIDSTTGYTVYEEPGVPDTGTYSLWLTYDFPPGTYFATVTASCEFTSGCTNKYMGSASSQSGTTAVGRSGVFTITPSTAPPPSPKPPPPPPKPPSAPFEIPIIQAFKEQFGTNDPHLHMVGQTSAASGNSCQYVCALRNHGGRRLLFGGLQYAGAVVSPCTSEQITCGCAGCV